MNDLHSFLFSSKTAQKIKSPGIIPKNNLWKLFSETKIKWAGTVPLKIELQLLNKLTYSF